MRHLLQCRPGIPIFGWTKRSVWEDFHAFLARSSAACALRRGGGVGLRDDRCRCPRRSRRKLRQPRLANLLRAAVDDDVARRAADGAQHDAAGAAGRTHDDFNALEKALDEVQSPDSAEDLARLRRHVTPEMLSYFSEELSANASKDVVNRISDVKLLQGDLAEAWREGDTDYATVAMRFSLNDETVERDSGRVLQGGPEEATEVWTFMRVRGGHWLVSAIQQS